MDLAAFHAELRELYGHGEPADNREIIRRVTDALPILEGLTPSPVIGGIYRYPMLAHYREGRYKQGDDWWKRAMAQFSATGYLKGIAILLVTPSFRSLDLVTAHAAAGEVALMVANSVDAISHAATLLQPHLDENVVSDGAALTFAQEKYAYCLFRLGDYDLSITAYERALAQPTLHTPKLEAWQRRHQLKIRGGRALAIYFKGNPQAALAELADIELGSRSGGELEDVHHITVENLELARGGIVTDPNQFHHYDIR